jgi:prephenate dehydrogenase
MAEMKTVGIIGLGSFGSFAAATIAKHSSHNIYGYEPKSDSVSHPHLTLTDLPTVAHADIVILAVPLSAYTELFAELQQLIRPETLLVDICSVKVYPEQYFDQYFPDHPNVLLTHPLFGPQTASDNTAGHVLIVTRQKGNKAHEAIDFCKQQLGLQVHNMTSEQHDRHMAQVHVLTFFVARGLANLNIDAGMFITPSYKMIMDLVEFDRVHTDDLFQTIQHGNPFAADIRDRVVKSFADLTADLKKKEGLSK